MAMLEAVGIVVKDMEASMRFYRLLGLGYPETATDNHMEAVTPSGFRVMLDDIEMVKSFMPTWVEPTGYRMGLAFRCANPTDVDRTYLAVLEGGFEGKAEPWDAPWGQRYAQVLDPDGNVVDLFADLA